MSDSSTSPERMFQPILELIQQARARVVRSLNCALVDLYWSIGREIDAKVHAAGWGRGTIEQLAAAIRAQTPSARGFSPPNLWRIRQFHQATLAHPALLELGRALGWSHLLAVLGRCNSMEEREFYLVRARDEQWSVRELQRQLDSTLYLRAKTSPAILSTPLKALLPRPSPSLDACADPECPEKTTKRGLTLSDYHQPFSTAA